MTRIEYTLEILKGAGWYEGRKVDISKQVEKLKYEYRLEELSNVQLQYLESFSNLTIVYPDLYAREWERKYGDPQKQDDMSTLDTHTLENARNVRHRAIYYYETHARLKHYDKNLVIIAKDPEGLKVYMSETGNMYGYFDQGFICYGNDVLEMFSQFFHGDRPPVEEIDEEDRQELVPPVPEH